MRCQRLNCSGTIEPRIVEHGRVEYGCAACDRQRAGLCQTCPARVASSRHWFCAACKKARHLEQNRLRDRERYPRRRKRILARWKARMQDPAFRAHRQAYMKDYKAVRTELDRKIHREYMQQRRSDEAFRQRQNARKRQLRAKKRQGCAA